MPDLHSSSQQAGELTSSPGENYILDHTSGRREGGGLNYAKVKSPIRLASKHRVTKHSSADCALHQGTTLKRALATYQTADIYYDNVGLTTVRGYVLTKLAYYINF